MRRCMPLCLVLVVLSACRGGDAIAPLTTSGPPDKSISDGNHCPVPGEGCAQGNPDFFWLLPLVPDPKPKTTNWEVGAANANLSVTVDICELDATSEAAIRADPDHVACKAGGYKLSPSAQVGSRNISYGPLDERDIDALKTFVTHYAPSFGEPYYHYGWQVPRRTAPASAPPAFFRVKASVGTKLLGYLDFEQPSNLRQLLNVHTGEFVPLVGGIKLPINFRVERYALCAIPGVGPCTSKAIDAGTGGLVSTTLPEDSLPSGLLLPPQPPPPPGSPPEPTRNYTISPCTSLNPRALDLPVFGRCFRLTIDPAPTVALANPAVAFSCEVTEAFVGVGSEGGISSAQAERITLHRLGVQNAPPGIAALPHAHPDCTHATANINAPTLRGVFAALAHGQVRAAAKRMAALLAPRPLYAARFIDLGGGGPDRLAPSLVDGFSRAANPRAANAVVITTEPTSTSWISDYQFALPARFEAVPSTIELFAPFGAPVSIGVKVVDVGGAPVRGATVRFSADHGGSVSQDGVGTTGADGSARVIWTMGPATGVNMLTASGQGIAGVEFDPANYPHRPPYQPLQTHWGDATNDATPVRLPSLPGSITLKRTGVATTTVCSNAATTSIISAPDGTTPRAPSVVDLLDFDWGSGLGETRVIAGSSWINGSLDGSRFAGVDPEHPTTYQTTFDAAPGMVLTGSIMFDDTADVLLNGVSMPIIGGDVWRAPGTFSSTGLIGGKNTIRIVSLNTGGPGGIDYCFSTSVSP